MPNNCNFPSEKYEVFAMLYVQSQDLSQKSPVEIAEMYEQAYSEISHYYGNKINERIQGGSWSL